MVSLVFCDSAVLFVGPLPSVGWHRHAAPAVVCGLDKPVVIETRTGIESYRCAHIPAGCLHAPDFGGGLAVVLYFQPGGPWTGRAARGTNSKSVAAVNQEANWIDLFHRCAGLPACDIPKLLALSMEDLLLPGDSQPKPDPRIAQMLDRTPAREAVSLKTKALSQSRLRHLFAEAAGVAHRRYKVWLRLQHAATLALRGHSMTSAALDAGFSDSSHFSRAFRDMFGVAPSSVLKTGVTLVDARS